MKWKRIQMKIKTKVTRKDYRIKNEILVTNKIQLLQQSQKMQ